MNSRRQRKCIRRSRRALVILVLLWMATLVYICLQGMIDERSFTSNVLELSKTRGYHRAKHLRDICKRWGYSYHASYKQVLLEYSTLDGNVQLCPVWKAGTTFIKRVFMMKTLKRFKNLTNPYNISFLEPFKKVSTQLFNGSNTKRFIFVRNPFDRLLSGYVDKLLAPNPVYWIILGVPAIQHSRSNPSNKSILCGHDLTFKEYVQYVIFALKAAPAQGKHKTVRRRRLGVSHDGHFKPMTESCKPCVFQYDFVGKMESFAEDSLELMHELNLTETEQILRASGSDLAVTDAIEDTVNQPFDPSFQSGIIKCITKKEALERSWQKLKIRGLIGDRELNITVNEALKMTHRDLLNAAQLARQDSTKEERVRLKEEYFKKLYSTIPETMLNELSIIYKEDFELFSYASTLKIN